MRDLAALNQVQVLPDTQDVRVHAGDFGVVTAFTFRAHPLPSKVFSGNFVYG